MPTEADAKGKTATNRRMRQRKKRRLDRARAAEAAVEARDAEIAKLRAWAGEALGMMQAAKMDLLDCDHDEGARFDRCIEIVKTWEKGRALLTPGGS